MAAWGGRMAGKGERGERARKADDVVERGEGGWTSGVGIGSVGLMDGLGEGGTGSDVGAEGLGVEGVKDLAVDACWVDGVEGVEGLEIKGTGVFGDESDKGFVDDGAEGIVGRGLSASFFLIGMGVISVFPVVAGTFSVSCAGVKTSNSLVTSLDLLSASFFSPFLPAGLFHAACRSNNSLNLDLFIFTLSSNRLSASTLLTRTLNFLPPQSLQTHLSRASSRAAFVTGGE
jgi:hypothetical protein